MEIGVKNEFFGSFNTVAFCPACLSTDKALSPVSKYVDILYKICELQYPILRMDNAQMCWECISLLNKVKLFAEKIAVSQKKLESFVKNSQDPFPLSLSKLTSSQANTHYITLIYEDIEIKPIKVETDLEDNFDSFDNADNCTDVKDELEVKPESPKLDKFEDVAETSANTDDKLYRKLKEFNLKRNAKRQCKYRFVNSKVKLHRKDMVRNIPVEEEVLRSGLEEERNNSLFVKERYKCVGCVEVLGSKEELVRHNNKYHDLSGSFVCRVCLVRCRSRRALAAHGRAHGARRECRVCGLRCCAARAMRRHLAAHDRMVQCLACGLFYKNVRLFYDHYKAMHSFYECDECGKRCKSREIIIRHLRCHFGYVCPFCKKKLKNSSSYNNHVECQHSAARADGAYCVQCDRRFKNDRLYKRHLQASSAHAAERDNSRIKRKYPCPECSNVYSRRVYMNNHYRHVHTKQSKHYCEQCDRHFLNRTRFTDHRRFKHEGVRRDKDKLCNICGRGFAANRTLINHIRTHSGERPFACEHCGAKFTQKHAMLSHVKYIHLKSRRKPSWHE